MKNTKKNSDSKFIEEQKKALHESIEFFSGDKKQAREIWVCREFLKNFNIAVSDDKLRSGDDPPDVVFDSAWFEVKEIQDKDRRRHMEYKAALKRAEAATKPSDLLEHYKPKTISTEQAIDIILQEIRKLSSTHKYAPSVRRSLDLLFYLNLRDTAINGNSIDTNSVQATINAEWRSVSFVSNNCSIVIWANEEAPSFLRERVGAIAYKN